MSEIELKARELLAAECPECGGENGHDTEDGWLRCGRCSDPHTVTRYQATQAIIAALSQVPGDVGIPTSVTQWQPIESAPKDGTRLMLWDSRAGGYAVTGAWVAGSADDHETITHWQPLPAPPEGEG